MHRTIKLRPLTWKARKALVAFSFQYFVFPISVIPQTLHPHVSFIDLHIAFIPLKVVKQAPSSVADYFTSVFIHCLQQLSEVVL